VTVFTLHILILIDLLPKLKLEFKLKFIQLDFEFESDNRNGLSCRSFTMLNLIADLYIFLVIKI